ncbi:hypothetical protein [Blastococcus xanthinilyticus]|uniref:Uncharacterized protein n=1 Tax=Blastococcus xanthinilyticus TaxID=1564164 RepID=A0A5S5CSY4_9ACTN|nr:hypothetical protein [Blastococcus xanthinilyticus]TYP86911.1 hypothetical protein BD833_108197 [Blastococcus xanthinilyticus]
MSDPIVPSREDADAKAWFYLGHRPDIETWAGLRAEGRQLLEKHLMGVAGQVEELAEDFDAEFETNDLDSGSWPRAGLRRATWTHDGIADVSVVIQWERARLLTPGSNEWPYVAVRLPADAADEERRRQLSEAMKPVRAQLAGSSSRTFPFWRYVHPPAGVPLDPHSLVADLGAAFRELWDAAAPVLDALHARPGSGAAL